MRKEELQRRLKHQFHYALWEFIIAIILLIWLIAGRAYINNDFLYYRKWFWWIIVIPNITIWILGIINAVKIEGMTHNSTVLIIFAVIPLYFVHLIFAIKSKNEFKDYTPITTTLPTQNSMPKISKKDHLKDAFIKGIISAKEYEDKLKKLNEKDESVEKE